MEGIAAGGVGVEAMFPELAEATAAVDAPEGEDVFGARLGPPHARLLAPSADDGFASGLDHAGADEVARGPEGSVLHARDVAYEVSQLFLDLGFSRRPLGLLSSLLDEAFYLVLE